MTGTRTAAGGLLLGATLLMTACSGGDAPAPEGSTAVQSSAPSSPTAATTSAAPTDTTPTDTTPTDSSSSAPTSSAEAPTTVPSVSSPTWQVPTDVPGWEPAILGENGVDQLADQDGCQYTATLNPVEPTPGVTDAEATEQLEQGYIWSFDPSQEPRHEQSRAAVRTPEEGTVEVRRVDTAHTDPAGEQYRSVMLLRVLSADSTQLSLLYTCPASTFDQAELDQLLSQTTLLGVDPADL